MGSLLKLALIESANEEEFKPVSIVEDNSLAAQFI
jgi:hypothetical protein